MMWSPAAAAHSNAPAPLIAILTPHDGASLNAATLRVQALVAAVRPRRGESFVFNGQTVAGRNAGRVRYVELALDGVPVRSIETADYGRQLVADFEVLSPFPRSSELAFAKLRSLAAQFSDSRWNGECESHFF